MSVRAGRAIGARASAAGPARVAGKVVSAVIAAGMGLAFACLTAASAAAQTDPASTAEPAAAPAAASAPSPAPAATPAPAQQLEWVDGPRSAPPIFETPHDLTPWGMFLGADWVVKAVILTLLAASVLTWTVWLAKSLEIAGQKRRLAVAGAALNAARDLKSVETAASRDAAAMTTAAAEELALASQSPGHGSRSGVKERIALRLDRVEIGAARRLGRAVGVLATIGATAPFVGLFGTVWGIMNAFIGISESRTTNLAVVAPGIAEALLATAFGLVAAIPAVVIYNGFSRAVAGYRTQLGDVSAQIAVLASRELDHLAIAA